MFKRSSRVLLVTLLLFVLAGATYAFAASNTVPETYAGDGEGGVKGYNVTNIHYVVNGADIESVTFSVVDEDGGLTATDVKASMDDGTTWSNCTIGGNGWTCNISGVTVLSATSLRVIAVQ